MKREQFYTIIISFAALISISLSSAAQNLQAVVTAVSNSNCGMCDGEGWVTATGGITPYTYQWNDPMNQTTSIATNLCEGYYLCVVMDSNTDTDTVEVFIYDEGFNGPSIPIVNDVMCWGNCDGAINVTIPGSDYQYLWCDGTLGPIRTDLCAGEYCVSITSQNGCVEDLTIIVPEPAQVVIDFGPTDSDPNTCDGSADATVSNAFGLVSYIWSNGATTSTVSDLCPGSISLCIVDQMGCVACDSVTIQPKLPGGIGGMYFGGVVKVFPNPTFGNFNIHTGSSELEHVNVIDYTGKVVFNKQFSGSQNSTNINLEPFKPGIYVIEIYTKDGLKVNRLQIIESR